VNDEHGILCIVYSPEHILELETFEFLIEFLQVICNLRFDVALIGFFGNLDECSCIFSEGMDLVPRIYPILPGIDFLEDFLCRDIIVPEVGFVRLRLEFF